MAKDTKVQDAHKKPAKAAPKSNKKPNPIVRLFQYFKDVRVELKRVTWPTRKEVLNFCVVVVVTLVFFALFTTVIDMASTEAITFLGGGKTSVESTATPTAETTATPSPETTAAPQGADIPAETPESGQ